MFFCRGWGRSIRKQNRRQKPSSSTNRKSKRNRPGPNWDNAIRKKLLWRPRSGRPAGTGTGCAGPLWLLVPGGKRIGFSCAGKIGGRRIIVYIDSRSIGHIDSRCLFYSCVSGCPNSCIMMSLLPGMTHSAHAAPHAMARARVPLLRCFAILLINRNRQSPIAIEYSIDR